MHKYSRKILFLILDAVLINISALVALLLRFEGVLPTQYSNNLLYTFIPITILQLSIFAVLGLYKSLWKYAGIYELIQVTLGTLLASLSSFIFGVITQLTQPKTYFLIWWLVSIVLIGGIRLSYRIVRKIKGLIKNKTVAKVRVMIIGAGSAAAVVIREMRSHEELNYIPIVVIDDDKRKHCSAICGVYIEGDRTKIKTLVEKHRINEIHIAIPSASRSDLHEILTLCKETKCKLKTLPGIYEIIDGKVSLEQMRDVSIEDLLGREEISLNNSDVAGYIENATVLVTGGGGSIGSELCRQISNLKPKHLIIFDIYENNAYELQFELLRNFAIFKDTAQLSVLIGSVRDKQRLFEIFDKYHPDVVFHAAAHKHVPLMEESPSEAIKNNVKGTLNTAQCADKFGVKKFVLISTDKAVNPTNIMGATKRIAEMIVQSLDTISETEFVAVRFGNVLGSNGSVIPLFKKQIANGGPITITHKEITRFFMTIPEAAQLVIQAGALAQGGEVFVLDMGEPVKIYDLARDLIKLSGYEPDVDIKIEYTGLRAGEKLYEELLMEEEGLKKTSHKKIFIGSPLNMNFDHVLMNIKALERCMEDPQALRRCMKTIVCTYQWKDQGNELAVNDS